jgi:signal transduction histidine kinase
MREDKTTPKVLPSWPVIVGLGTVTLLIAGMIALDIHFAEEEAARTTDIIENAQSSIVLLNRIRVEVRHLVLAKDLGEAERLRQAIAQHGRDYDPIATYSGERTRWSRLQDLLRQLLASDLSDGAGAAKLVETIEQAVDELATLNTAAGRGNLAAIKAAHRRAIWSDVAAGVVVLAVVALISGWLLRVLAQKRRLILRQVQFLDEKNAELEAFAGRAAHDLRSPMSPIRGYADLILEAPGLPENLAAMARRIRRSVERMNHVVDDMLALAVSGRPPEGQCESGAVVERVLEEMGAELEGIEVTTELAAGRVACAESTLSQILRNLVGNAIKYRSRSRPPRITVETREVGDRVEIGVVDNGVGMDAESAKRVFEPFFRGTTDQRVPGHGLGLAIVERLSRALGGGCELRSEPEQGTRIVVRLPRA